MRKGKTKMSRFTNTVNDTFTNVLYDGTYRVRHMEAYYQPQTEYDIYLTDVLWPRSRGLNNGAIYDTDTCYQPQATWYNWPTQNQGSRSVYLISGITKNSSGNALGNCTVNAFTTADKVLQGTTTSDGQGNYQCPTFSNGNHFLVAFKTGTPDTAGSTDNDIVGV